MPFAFARLAFARLLFAALLMASIALPLDTAYGAADGEADKQAADKEAKTSRLAELAKKKDEPKEEEGGRMKGDQQP